jgi:hypothetical protein
MTPKNDKKRFSTLAAIMVALTLAITGSAAVNASRSEAVAPKFGGGQGEIIIGSVPMSDGVISSDDVEFVLN